MSQQDIDDLQTRIAFQEDMIDGLNEQLALQRQEIEKLAIQVQHLYTKYKDLSIASGADDDSNVPPPHY